MAIQDDAQYNVDIPFNHGANGYELSTPAHPDYTPEPYLNNTD